MPFFSRRLALPTPCVPCARGNGPRRAAELGHVNITRILAAIGLGFILTVVGFKVVVPDDPYAMLDDTYLNTLKGDDDVANDAARRVRTHGFAFYVRA